MEPTSTGNPPSTNKVSAAPRRAFGSFVSDGFTLSLSVPAEPNKHADGSGVIQSAKFPAAQPPDPNQPSKIETEYWPCPPSLAAMGNRLIADHTWFNGG